ncbi:MAG: response regulator [Candidatus Bathyarchaeota archaeon]|nr:response regulator [Candidatus Bathyarchaeota archaeon]
MARKKKDETTNFILETLKDHSAQLELILKELTKLKKESKKTKKKKGKRKADPSLKSILVVDDNQYLLKSYQHVLESVGLNVDTSDKGLAALYKSRMKHYDLIIIDLILPDMGGDTLAKMIRDYDKKVKMVMITGYQSYEEDLVSNTHIDEFLLKPIAPESLIKLTEKMMNIQVAV